MIDKNNNNTNTNTSSMEKIRTFLSSLPQQTITSNDTFKPEWDQGYGFDDSANANANANANTNTNDTPEVKRRFTGKTILGAFLPYVNKIVYLFTEPMLVEAEEHLRRAIIECVTLPEISTFLGKRNSTKLATYLEMGKGAPDMEIICKLLNFLFDINIVLAESENASENDIMLVKDRIGWTTSRV